MELDVRGTEESRLTLASHPRVVLTPMNISDRSPTSSSICTAKHKGDSAMVHHAGARLWS